MADVHKALKQLDHIWFKFREERVHIPQNPEAKEFKKFTLMMVNTTYDDPRARGTRRSLCVIVVPAGKTLNTEMAHTICEHCTENAVHHVVIVRQRESKKVASLLAESGVVWETLTFDELHLNKLEYHLVPRYSVMLTDAERKEVFRVAGTTDPRKLPRILFRKDPIGRLLGFRMGDIVKTVRADANTIEVVGYRHVTDDATANAA